LDSRYFILWAEKEKETANRTNGKSSEQIKGNEKRTALKQATLQILSVYK
jgi:hypothetical protein